MGKAKLPVDKVKKSRSKPKNTGSNTAAHAYVSNFNTIKDCKINKEAVSTNCISKLSPHPELNPNSATKWIIDHCESLMHKPGDEAGLWGELKEEFHKTDSSYPEVEKIKKKYENNEGKFSPSALVADRMHDASIVNLCINARRCLLVKYGDTNTKVIASKGKGCCPGQTGHHLLPSAMFAHCTPPYKESRAPTICAEGANNSNGSHGNIHRELRTILKNLKKNNGEAVPYNSPIEMKDAIASGVASVKIAFPTSGCNPVCITAQLDDYYKEDKLCKPNSHPGIDEVPDKVVVQVKANK